MGEMDELSFKQKAEELLEKSKGCYFHVVFDLLARLFIDEGQKAIDRLRAVDADSLNRELEKIWELTRKLEELR